MSIRNESSEERDPHQTPVGLALRRIFTQFTIEIDANPDLAANEVIVLSRLRNHFLLSTDLYQETLGILNFSTRFDYAHLINTRRGQLLNPSLPVHLREDPDISSEHYLRIGRLRSRIDRARDESCLPGAFEPSATGRESTQLNQVARLYRDSHNFRHCVAVVQQRAAGAQGPARALLGLRGDEMCPGGGPETPPPLTQATDRDRERQPPQLLRSGDFVMAPPVSVRRYRVASGPSAPPLGGGG